MRWWWEKHGISRVIAKGCVIFISQLWLGWKCKFLCDKKKPTPSPFCGIYLMVVWMRSDNPTITNFFFTESEPFSMFSNTNSTNTFAFGYVTLHPIIWIPYVIYGCIILWTASGLQISNGLRVNCVIVEIKRKGKTKEKCLRKRCKVVNFRILLRPAN